jgi:hypothetical protein
MGYELDKLKRQYGVGTANIASYGGQTLGAPPAETATPEQKAAFQDQLRKYQIDQRAYKAYTDEYANRLATTNPYADPQFDTNQARFRPTQPPAQPSALTPPARFRPTQPPAQPSALTPPAPRTPLNPITYGAIPANVSAATDQGAMYKQMRDLGYTDADIRKATATQIGAINEQKWTDVLNNAYSQYQPMITSAYQQLGRTGFGADPAQIDYGGYNYWLNQLSSGAVRPEDLNKAVLTAGTVTTNPGTGTVTTGPGAGTVTTTPPIYGDINQIYQQYFNRPAEQEGLNYWAQSGFTGDTLKNAIIAGAQGPDLTYYQQNFTQSPDPYYGGAARGGYISKYAEGGRVRTHYQTGGQAGEGNLDELDAFYRDPRNFTRPQTSPMRTRRLTYQQQMEAARPDRLPEMRAMPIESIGEGAGIIEDPPARLPGLMEIANTGEGFPVSGVVEPAAGAQTAEPSRPAGSQNPMEAILARYLGGSGEASRELALARQRSQTESEAFYNLIRQMAERGESPTSRSEMYFRLAAAFGAPTRTGAMGETLSKVGEQMGEYTRGRQADERERRGLLVRAQEARMAGAREDLATTRALAAQESTERAGVVRELVKEYIRSGEPQTEAEKEARALGLVGQEKADFVRRRIMANVQQAENRLTALDANELKTYNDNRELSDRTKVAIEDLRRAITLNSRTLPGGIAGRVALGVGTAIGSDAQIIQNSEQLQNILSGITLQSLKATFPGAISNAEREALEKLSGATSASLQSRERIMRDALRRLETMVENADRRMLDVQTRANRYVQPRSNSTEPTR